MAVRHKVTEVKPSRVGARADRLLSIKILCLEIALLITKVLYYTCRRRERERDHTTMDIVSRLDTADMSSRWKYKC